MAIPKVVGIETEYGILVRGADVNPIAASSLLVNAYISQFRRRVTWDFEDESPANDARGFLMDGALPPDVETHLVNAVLTNGARYYVDHAHPEVSTPECVDALEIVRWDRAAELIVRRSMALAQRLVPDGAEVVAYKNNSDGKGNSYGCHENYLVAREVPFGRIVSQVTPHFVTRQIFCGAGKVGCELPGVSARDVPFQLSQRADFFEEEVGLETTLKRPIVNTRDEPHCDATKYRRLHVIVGDANMSEVATFLKVGTSAIVLAMIEDDVMGAEVLRRWEEVLAGLESDRDKVASVVDWVAKERVLHAFADRHGLAWGDVKLRAIDLQYHDMRPEKCLADRVGLETIVSLADAESAMTEPPETTRAYFRGRCLAKWPEDVVAANWDSLVFDVGDDPLRRVPMMEPRRGTAEMVGSLIDECSTARQLLDRLGA
jgi:Pup amidohydrolase